MGHGGIASTWGHRREHSRGHRENIGRNMVDMGDMVGNIGTRNGVYRRGHMWEMGTLCN